MNAFLAPLALAADGTISPGETAFFWIVAPLIVVAALALMFARKPVYAAVAMVFVMIGLAAMYIAQEAFFLGIVQIIVYTGAIMMLFLFVLMLIGVDVSESILETIKGQRVAAAIFGFGVLIGLAGVVVSVTAPQSVGLEAANADTNPVGVAIVIFQNYPFTMQLAGALLIVAALSAMTLTHTDRIGPKIRQKDIADAKMAAWAERGGRIAQLPSPGVYSRTNRATVPAIGPDGEPVEGSVAHVLRIRGQEDTIADVAPEAIRATLTPGTVGLTRAPGMPGEAAPDYAAAPRTETPGIGTGGGEAPAHGPDLPADEKEEER
ncbi:MAG TPA: NADH-quinone oxidoreductase subunit J [Actinomycetaceae bacterium]|nr:NADH-quinone oxidoreductase subunit J [Actinomycetaceae bacterium]